MGAHSKKVRINAYLNAKQDRFLRERMSRNSTTYAEELRRAVELYMKLVERSRAKQAA